MPNPQEPAEPAGMSPVRRRHVNEIFRAAQEYAPSERGAFLKGACADDATLRAEVEKLLSADAPASDSRFLDPAAVNVRGLVDAIDGPAANGEMETAESPATDPLRFALDGYEILRELSHGGQGVVYQAVQKTTKRKVAIKLLLEGQFASKSTRRRFEREIELVAQLKHPNIISIFHSGETADGRQYYVMDYVRGLPLDRYVREKKLTLEEALRLFATVCNAVQYAHQRGIIHRDLKPSNILVDANGTPHVLDFGLAKSLAAPVDTVMTLTHAAIGTLPYMSPEQARGNPDEIDTRTDIYALGVVLYEILTGHYPYPVVGQMAEVFKHITETAPTPPSRAWKSDSGVTQRSRKRLRAGQCPIDDEVQTIVLRLLAKERERRYQSAGELARDIGHYLNGEPIEAKRDSFAYLLKNYVWRRRRSVGVSVMVLALLGLSFVAYRMYLEAGRAAERTQREQWTGVLQLSGANAKSEDYQEAIDRLCELVASGRSTAHERAVLASEMAFFHFTERELISLEHVYRDDAGYRLRLSSGFGRHASIGGLVTVRLKLDGAPVAYDLPRVFLAGGSRGAFLLTPQLAAGRHVLAGTATIKFGRELRGDAVFDEVSDYELFNVPDVQVPIGPFEFVVIERYPPNYPTAIKDSGYARRFAQEFRLEKVALQSRPLTGQHIESSNYALDPFDALCVDVSFPTPPLDIACLIRLRSPGLREEYKCLVVLAPRREGNRGDTRIRVSLVGDGTACALEAGERDIISICVAVRDLLGPLRSSELAGLPIEVEITPSREAALFASKVERYLAVEARAEARVADSRDAARRDAETVLRELFERGARPSEIVEMTRAMTELSESVREEAIGLAQSLFSDAASLNGVAWSIVKRPDENPGWYRCAATWAHEASRLAPDDGYILNTLGVAQYRMQAFEDALKTLTRSHVTNSKQDAGGLPADVAFIAMTLHKLGRTDEAKEVLARLRDLMQEPRHSGDEESQAFLREAVALIVGTSEPTSRPAKEFQP